MVDGSRGGNATYNGPASASTPLFTDADNVWGNGSTTNRQSAGVDAHFGIATTWDYYKTTFGRNGIANDGKGARSFVHDGAYVNASWNDSCFCMRYGDGDATTYPLVALDVAGHEMSHGVTSRSANLTYRGESGGLNEATSDIFGTMVEFFANNANDTGDYLIGEEIYRSYNPATQPIRHMDKPSMDGGSQDCWTTRTSRSTCTTPPARPTTSSTCCPRAAARRRSTASPTTARPATAPRSPASAAPRPPRSGTAR